MGWDSGGVPAFILMLAYTLVFFSTNHDFITFTDQNARLSPSGTTHYR